MIAHIWQSSDDDDGELTAPLEDLTAVVDRDSRLGSGLTDSSSMVDLSIDGWA